MMTSRLSRLTRRGRCVCQSSQQLDRGIRTGYLSGSKADVTALAQHLCLFYTEESVARVAKERK
jgi:hypothetical protein